MEAIINKLLRLNLEIDGYLWVLKTRRTAQAQELLTEKVNEFNALLQELPELERVNTDLPELTPDYRQEAEAAYDAIETTEQAQEEPAEPELPEPEPVEAEPELPEPEQVEEEVASTDSIEEIPADSEPVEEVPAEPELPEPEPVEEPAEPELPEPEPVEEPAEPELPEPEPVEEKPVEDEHDIRLTLMMDNDPEQYEPQVPEQYVPKEPEQHEPQIPETRTEYRVEDMLTRKGAHADLSKAFTLNDKFRFIRGIFCEDKNDFEYTLAQLSEFESLGEVYDYLLNELGWDIDNEEVKDFISIVANHFNDI